jgi:3-oxocholest-4-en-26-oate---CoA ligase
VTTHDQLLSTGGWTFADIWEFYTAALPDAPAQWHSGQHTTWSEFNSRANGVADALLAGGAKQGDRVVQYLYNGPHYLETIFGCFKLGLVPVNTNYRYGDDEVAYIWDNADAVAVVFHGSFAERCARIRLRVPSVRQWIWVDDGSGACPEWAIPYEAAAMSGKPANVSAPWGRSSNDMLFLYTGGTTGMPKGTMWRQEDLIGSFESSNRINLGAFPSLDVLAQRSAKPGPRNLPAAPLMHGTGLFGAFSNLNMAGSIVTLANRSFAVTEFLDTVQSVGVNSTSIVGDAFAKPILRALDAEPQRWDISSMRVIVSSGVMWSAETKAGLLTHNPRLIMVDTLGSSEAIGMASNTTTAGAEMKTATFTLGPNTKVLNDDGNEVAWGTEERGRVALKGFTPAGYWKDPVKSEATFPVYNGVRYSIPGDWATVDADGVVNLLGRGSQCINTGGEKVYPEEVEEVLKLHASVADAAVVGLPDERFGQAITALVELHPDADFEAGALVQHVKDRLASYKAPKSVFVVATIGRAPNGKLDYKSLTSTAVSLAAQQ